MIKRIFNLLFNKNKTNWFILVENKFIYGYYDYYKAKRLAHEMDNSTIIYLK